MVETTAMDIQILSKIFFIFMSIENLPSSYLFCSRSKYADKKLHNKA